MPRTRAWKDAEKGVAAMLGGKRLSNTALGLPSADVETPAYSVEVKSRQNLPAWLINAVAQARRNAPEDKLPIVVAHQVGQRRVNDLVIVRLGDFIEWFGDVTTSSMPLAEDDARETEGGMHDNDC